MEQQPSAAYGKGPHWLMLSVGWILDKVGSSLRNAMILQMVAASVALIASVLAFMVAPSLAAFAPLLAIGLLGIFIVQAPLCKPQCLTIGMI